MPRVFMYVVTGDSGFAPNPFHGWCTLACCKPVIRRTARKGDWVVGITPRRLGNGLLYAMRVDEVLTFQQYWSDRRFRAKRPTPREGRPTIERCGDNCYQPIDDGEFRQLRRSGHWDHDADRQDDWAMGKDLRGVNVLVSGRFCYYGENAKPFPPDLRRFPTRGHRVNFGEGELAALLRHLAALPPGVHGRPARWKEGDTSWRQDRPGCG